MNRIRIRLKAYDHNLIDKSMGIIVKTANIFFECGNQSTGSGAAGD